MWFGIGNPLIPHEFFSWGMCLQGMFFSLQRSAWNFFGVHDKIHATLKSWTPADVLTLNGKTSAGGLIFPYTYPHHRAELCGMRGVKKQIFGAMEQWNNYIHEEGFRIKRRWRRAINSLHNSHSIVILTSNFVMRAVLQFLSIQLRRGLFS